MLLALGRHPSSVQRPLFIHDVTRCDGCPSHEFDFVLFALLSFCGFNLVLDVAVFEPLGGVSRGVFFDTFFFDTFLGAANLDFEGLGTWSDCRIFKDLSLSPLYTRT